MKNFKLKLIALVLVVTSLVLVGCGTPNNGGNTEAPAFDAAAAVAGILGTLTNTLLVLGGIYIFFGNEYYAMAVADSSQTLLVFLGTVILTNGLPEAVIGGIAGSAIAVPVKKAVKKYM